MRRLRSRRRVAPAASALQEAADVGMPSSGAMTRRKRSLGSCLAPRAAPHAASRTHRGSGSPGGGPSQSAAPPGAIGRCLGDMVVPSAARRPEPRDPHVRRRRWPRAAARVPRTDAPSSRADAWPRPRASAGTRRRRGRPRRSPGQVVATAARRASSRRRQQQSVADPTAPSAQLEPVLEVGRRRALRRSRAAQIGRPVSPPRHGHPGPGLVRLASTSRRSGPASASRPA